MAARILAMRLIAASLSLALSREVLFRGVKTGEVLCVEVGAEVGAEAEALLLLPAVDADGAWLAEPLILRNVSNAMIRVSTAGQWSRAALADGVTPAQCCCLCSS